MTALPAAGYFTDDARNNGEAKQGQDDMLAAMRELLGGDAETTIALAGGQITPTRAVHSIDTEGGVAADDLSNIILTHHPDGRLALLRGANPARVVTVLHAAGGAGQIFLADGQPFALDNRSKWLLLKRTVSDWEEIARFYGADKAGSRGFIGLGTTPIAASVPVGGMMWLPGAPPAGWLLCYGQNVLRADYPELHAFMQANGYPHGAGDGVTTFTLPDGRGRTLAGMDNMGGVAANRLTAAASGVNGAVLGAAGGNQWMQAHGHGVTDPGHGHSLGAPGLDGSGSTANRGWSTQPNIRTDGVYNTSWNGTGISIQSAGGGASQNVQPTLVENLIIFAGRVV